MPGYRQEIENIPKANDSDKEREALLKKLRTFREDEFANVLRDCHNIIRNRDHLDPTAAFDEIAKVLFVKVFVEREMRAKRASKNLFTVEVLEQQIGDDPLNILFEQTKKVRKSDRLFKADERIMLKPETSKAIVKSLEVYNLSDTSEDVKGIAFEKFLGRTFRGEIGQFFTPRPIVEFMIRMVGLQEGEVILDPAAGSGGFLIRAFELLREQILADADRQYQAEKQTIETTPGLSVAEKGAQLLAAYNRIQHEISAEREGGRLWHLANRCLYGTDANDRMARTAKMNMIMHGDGHGGVHHHDGLLNVNGIFEGRFNVILTNPPFGSSVEPTAKVLPNQVELAEEEEERYLKIYGEPYRLAREQQQTTLNKAIANLFELGRGPSEKKPLKQKTEILFVERCLNLLAPGGRLAVVLPEGIFNNPSLEAVRHHCEGRARLLAVVSLPAETFLSSGATVKCSLLFAQKFTEAEAQQYADTVATALAERTAHHAPARNQELERLDDLIKEAQATKQRDDLKTLRAERATYEKRLAATIEREARPLVKQRLDYPVFLYEADRVGITATGEPDLNELYPNAAPLHPDEPTALELYQQFQQDPAAFVASAPTEPSV
ncbi:type I restriction enzyme M protein [Hymenobacter psychrophilus]|uniref:Type I restriction enzyme M protein n=2 Tax=Hymenobacter psychrophilus TaxID=651662 RepID=A0A1H3I6R4_9BACT|nr:type I restriction enzyme M protein [Hymenobacter psychrophilus]